MQTFKNILWTRFDYFDLIKMTLHQTSDELIENMLQFMHICLKKVYYVKNIENLCHGQLFFCTIKHIICYNLIMKQKLSREEI